MALLKTVDDSIGLICRLVLYVTLTVVFGILAANVALRYAAGSSLAWASELPELLFPWMIMAGVVLAAQHGTHIAVVLVTRKLPVPVRRVVMLGGSLIVTALYLGLAVMAWPVLEIAADERTPILQVPGSVSIGCLMAGFCLLAVVTLCRLPQVWAQAALDDDVLPDPHAAALADQHAGPGPVISTAHGATK